MGTVLSTFPSYIYSSGEWDELQDVFQQGLYTSAQGNTELLKKYHDELGYASVKKSYKTNKHDRDDDDTITYKEKGMFDRQAKDTDDDLDPSDDHEYRHPQRHTDSFNGSKRHQHMSQSQHHNDRQNGTMSYKYDEDNLAVTKSSKRESRSASKPAFQPSQSRLPTPSRSRRSSNTAQEAVIPNNDLPAPNASSKASRSGPVEAEPSSRIPLKKEASAFRRKSDFANFNSQNQIQERSFQPEPWPPLEMMCEHLSKLDHPPSTLLFARFAPRNSKTFIEIQYSVNKDTNETVFHATDKLDTLIQNKDGSPVGESKESQIEYFFLIFKTCINLLQGQVWWNGYSLIFDQNNTKNRLKVSAFETEPSQLLFELTNMKDVEVHRSGHNIELRGKVESGEEIKSFRFRGPNVKDVKVNKLRGTLITVHLPEFSPESISKN